MAVTWRAYVEGTYEDNVAGIDAASAWAAHLPVARATLIPAVLATVAAHPALTGEYLHQPSYLQWGEPAKIGHGTAAGCDPGDSVDPDHLVLYYRAFTEAEALEVAGALLAMLTPTGAMPAGRHEVVLTHADDWDWDATITTDPTRHPRPAYPCAAPAPRDLGSLGIGQSGSLQVTGAPGGGYTLTMTTTAAGLPLLVVDTEEHARLRIDVNDAPLALVEAGGDEITLPAHWREFRTDAGRPPR